MAAGGARCGLRLLPCILRAAGTLSGFLVLFGTLFNSITMLADYHERYMPSSFIDFHRYSLRLKRRCGYLREPEDVHLRPNRAASQHVALFSGNQKHQLAGMYGESLRRVIQPKN